MSEKLSNYIKPGVVSGDELQQLFALAKKNQFALPAVNVVGTNSVNAVLEAGKVVNSPVIIQFSNGGAVFFAGQGLANTNEQAAIAGAVSGAIHIHRIAELYGIPVVIHTDHAARKLLPWIDGLLNKGEEHYQKAWETRSSARTCLIFQKNLLRKTLKPVKNIWNG